MSCPSFLPAFLRFRSYLRFIDRYSISILLRIRVNGNMYPRPKNIFQQKCIISQRSYNERQKTANKRAHEYILHTEREITHVLLQKRNNKETKKK